MSDKYYDVQRKQIISNIKKRSKALADDYMFDKEKAVKLGINLMLPFFEGVLKTQGKEAMLTLSIDKPYSLLDEARKFLSKQPTLLSKTITDTSYTRVRKSLADGLKKGESVPQLVKRINKDYDGLKRYQAENIARSEVSRATNFATEDAFIQSGVVEGKEWVVSVDDRLCEFCMSMESTYNSRAKLGKTFFKKGDVVTGVDGGTMKVDYDDIAGPPLHPQCRCILKPVFVFTKEAKPKKKTADDLLKQIDKELDGIKGTKTNRDEEEVIEGSRK